MTKSSRAALPEHLRDELAPEGRLGLQTLEGWADMTLIRTRYDKAAVERAALDEAARMDAP
jgi:hypothetical protein